MYNERNDLKERTNDSENKSNFVLDVNDDEREREKKEKKIASK